MPKQSTTEVEKSVQTEDEIYHNIDILVNKSHEALAQMEDFSQEDVDKLCQVIEKVGEDNARYLAQMAVDETGRGKAEDVTAVRSVWADLDVADMGASGKTLPTRRAAQAVIADLSGMLGTDPAAVVYSGHGLQPRWLVNHDAEAASPASFRTL